MKKFIFCVALSAVAFIATPALAGPVTVPAVLASANDVTLDNATADVYQYLGKINLQGKKGLPAVEAQFASDWSAIGAYKGAGSTTAHGQVSSPLQFSFSLATDKKSGNWSVTNTDLDNDVELDLLFAMHSGGVSGTWMFEDQVILSGQTLGGEWIQRLLNGGGNAGAYSNVTFFASNLSLLQPAPTPTDVAEPATLGTLMLGLGMLGFMARRRRQS